MMILQKYLDIFILISQTIISVPGRRPRLLASITCFIGAHGGVCHPQYSTLLHNTGSKYKQQNTLNSDIYSDFSLSSSFDNTKSTL